MTAQVFAKIDVGWREAGQVFADGDPVQEDCGTILGLVDLEKSHFRNSAFDGERATIPERLPERTLLADVLKRRVGHVQETRDGNGVREGLGHVGERALLDLPDAVEIEGLSWR